MQSLTQFRGGESLQPLNLPADATPPGEGGRAQRCPPPPAGGARPHSHLPQHHITSNQGEGEGLACQGWSAAEKAEKWESGGTGGIGSTGSTGGQAVRSSPWSAPPARQPEGR